MARKMKDSGIEWIGEIPESWEVRKVKHYYEMQTGFTPDTKTDSFYDDYDGYDWITISDINDGQVINDSKRKISQEYVDMFQPQIIPEGSLLYSFKLSVGQTAFAGKPLYSNEAIAAFLPRKDVNLRFLRYSSILIRENAEINIYNARILNRDRINNAYIVFPPLSDQHRIAAYLDTQCAKIDAVLEQTRNSIEEYKKLKQAVITQAVTKGIRPGRKMKDSGIEWIGEVPLEWNVVSFTKSISSIVDYRGKTPEKQDEGTLLVTARNIKDGRIDYDISKEYIRTEEYDEIMHRGKVEIGDVLFTTEAPLGSVANADRTDFALAQRIIKFRGISNTLNNYYMKYWMLSSGFQQNLATFATGSTAKGIKASKLGMLKQLLPPICEQNEIVEYLDRVGNRLDILIRKKDSLLTQLESYKKSLIYECVTGKREV